MKVFIDTNIPMYAAGKEHSFKAPSISLLHAIADGELDAVTDCEVFQEILHRYSALGRTEEGSELFLLFASLVGEILPVAYHDVESARQILLDHPGIKARDAIHAATMKASGLRIIYSYDQHFDDLSDIERLEPPARP